MNAKRGNTNVVPDLTAHTDLSRKDLLRRAGIGAGALALGAAVGATPVAARPAVPMVNLGRRTYRVGWVGATCEAFTYAAYAKHLWDRLGIEVELVHLSPDTTGADAIGTGQVDVAPGILYNYFKPIEQGVDVNLTAGLHGGCLRLVAGVHSGIKSYTDLKGKTIGTNAIGGSAMNFFSVALAKMGLDPTNDVSWRKYPPPLFGAALDKGEIQAVAAPDPFPYLLTRAGKAVEIGDNMTGMMASRFCCVVALSGALVRNDPKAAAALTRGLMHGSLYTGQHIHEVAGIEVADKFVPVDVSTVEHLLATYSWRPSASLLKPEIEQGARDYKLTGFLDKKTDPQALAAKAYVDIFKLAGEAP